MPAPDRRTRVNVAVRTNHHQMLRHLAAAMETTVQHILDRVLEQALVDVENMTVKELSNWVNTLHKIFPQGTGNMTGRQNRS
jgi:hypothetical protein